MENWKKISNFFKLIENSKIIYLIRNKKILISQISILDLLDFAHYQSEVCIFLKYFTYF